MTNPPIDAIREEIVTSTRVYIGGEGNLIKPSPNSSRQIKLMQPIITDEELARIKAVDVPGFNPCTLSILYNVEEDGKGIESAMERIYNEIDECFANGSSIFILSDRGVDEKHAAIPALLAVSGVQAYTIRKGIRTRLEHPAGIRRAD